MNALSELYLSFIPILLDAMGIVLIDYKVLLESARTELNLMVKVQNSRSLSRIGFVVQDMKDFQFEVNSTIRNRAIEIGMDAECILEAGQRLDEAAANGGGVIVSEAIEWNDLNIYLADYFIFYTTDEIEFIISLFEFELLNCFAYFNSVTNMFDLLLFYQTELQSFFNIFDYFVYYIYVDFYVYSILTNEMNRRMFFSLNNALEDFRAEGNRIIDSLADCNSSV